MMIAHRLHLVGSKTLVATDHDPSSLPRVELDMDDILSFLFYFSYTILIAIVMPGFEDF
jgi:hypothetical protein